MTTVVQPPVVLRTPGPARPLPQPVHGGMPPRQQQQQQQYHAPHPSMSQPHPQHHPHPHPHPQHHPHSLPQQYGHGPSPSNLMTITETGSAAYPQRSTAPMPFPEPQRQQHQPTGPQRVRLSALQLAQETGTPATGIYSQNGLWSDDSDEEEQRMSWRQRLSNSTSGERRSLKGSKSPGGTLSQRGSRSKMDISPLSVESPWPWSRKSTSEKHASTHERQTFPDQQEVLAGESHHMGSRSVRNSNQGSIRSINQGNVRHSGSMTPVSRSQSPMHQHTGSVHSSHGPNHQHTSSVHSVSSYHSASSMDMHVKQKVSLGRLRRKSTSKGGFNDFPEVIPAVPQIPAAMESVLSVRSQASTASRNSTGMPVTPQSPCDKPLKANPTVKTDPVYVSAMPSTSTSSLNKVTNPVYARSSPSPTPAIPPPSPTPSLAAPSVMPMYRAPSPRPPAQTSRPVPPSTPASKPAPPPATTSKLNKPPPASVQREQKERPKSTSKEPKERPKSFIKRGVERLWRPKSGQGLSTDFEPIEVPAPPVPELPSTLKSRNAASGVTASQISQHSAKEEKSATLPRISGPMANPESTSAIFPMPAGAMPLPPGAASPQPPVRSPVSPSPDQLASHLAQLDQKYPSFPASVRGKSSRSFNHIDPDEAMETDPFASAYDFPAPKRPISRAASNLTGTTGTRDSLMTLDEDVPRPWTPGLTSPSMRSLTSRLYKSKSFASGGGSRPSSMAMFFSKEKDKEREKSMLPPTPDLPQHTVVPEPLPAVAAAPPSPNPAVSSPSATVPTPAPSEPNTPVFYDSFDNVPAVPSEEPELEPRPRCASVTRGEIAQAAQVFPAPPNTGPPSTERLTALGITGGLRRSHVPPPSPGPQPHPVAAGVPVPGSGVQGQTPVPALEPGAAPVESPAHATLATTISSPSHRHHSSHSSSDADLLTTRHSASASGSSLELATPHPSFQNPIKRADHADKSPSRDLSAPRPPSTESFQQLYDQLDINPSTLQPRHSFPRPADDDNSFCDPQPYATLSAGSKRRTADVPFPEVAHAPRVPTSGDYAFPIEIPSQPTSLTACDTEPKSSRHKRMAVDYSLQRKGFNPRAASESPDTSSSTATATAPMAASTTRPATSSGHHEGYQRLGERNSRGSSLGNSQTRPRVRSGPEQWIDDMDTSSSENEQDETPLSQLHPSAAAQQQERRAASLARREARRAARERQLRVHKGQVSDGTLRPVPVWNGEGGVPADVLAGRLENVAISSASSSRAAPLRPQRSLRVHPQHREHDSPSPALSRTTTLSSQHPSRPSSARPPTHAESSPQPNSRPGSSHAVPRRRSHSISSRHAVAPPSTEAVPPLPRGRPTPVRCIVVADEIRQISLEVYPDTLARDILAQLKSKLPVPPAHTSWVVCEVFTERGLERQVRDYENVLSLVKGWDASAANCLAIRESALTLVRTVPEVAPLVAGWCHLEVKPRKWSKRYLETRGGQVFLSKNDKGKDEMQLNTLFCDIYRPQQSGNYPAPQPFIFAIKRLEAASSFEHPDEFMFTLASDESTGYKLHTAIYASRSFTIGTGNPNAKPPIMPKSIGRSKSTKEGSRRREEEKTLLNMRNEPSAFTGRGLLKRHGL